MKIAHNQSHSTNFNSLYRQTCYVDCNGVLRGTQNTTAAREDLDYVKFAQILKTRFEKFNKINVMPMNGSDGTEAYLLANAIIDVFGKEDAEKKVFPIKVTDVDDFIISNFGKKGIVAFEPKDIKHFKPQNFSKYFLEIGPWNVPKITNGYSEDTKVFKLKPEFRKYFQFEVMDLQERLENIKDKGNSVVIIRNCLKQSFGENETLKIINKIQTKLKAQSLFIIGGFDRMMMPNIVKYMTNLKFSEIEKNIFSSPTKNLLKQISNMIVNKSRFFYKTILKELI